MTYFTVHLHFIQHLKQTSIKPRRLHVSHIAKRSGRVTSCCLKSFHLYFYIHRELIKILISHLMCRDINKRIKLEHFIHNIAYPARCMVRCAVPTNMRHVLYICWKAYFHFMLLRSYI
jgi:hypothetical protein